MKKDQQDTSKKPQGARLRLALETSTLRRLTDGELSTVVGAAVPSHGVMCTVLCE
jgi:hypothetical protein